MGRYQGDRINSAGKSQVVGQVPAFRDEGQGKTLEITLYQTLGSSSGNSIRITVVSDQLIALVIPDFTNQPLELTKVGNCATSSSAGHSIVLCWANGKLDIDITQASVLSYSIHIKRDDSLPPIESSTGAGHTYSLDELIGRSKFLNYAVSQEAERILQAKERFKAARGNLLPKLSLRAVVGVFTGDYLSTVGAALPFLFPSNWFAWKSSKLMYEAERKSFASLRGNQMNGVEGLFYLVARDQAVLANIDLSTTSLSTIRTS